MLNENNHTYSFNLFESETLPFSNISVNLFNDIEIITEDIYLFKMKIKNIK